MKTLLTTYQDGIFVITLNRTDKKNAMNFLMMKELIKTHDIIKKDPRIRVVIIKGETDFCSGLDLSVFDSPKHMAFALYELAKPTPSLFQKVCLGWRDLPVPVIAVIDGVCFGAGLQLALGADFRISSRRATWSILEAKWGLVADMGLTHLAQDIPKATLKELTMTAKLIDGQRAYECKLATHISDDPMTDALALAKDIKDRSPDAVLASKRLINAMTAKAYGRLYQEKLWQLKMFATPNRHIALKRAKDQAVDFAKRRWG